MTQYGVILFHTTSAVIKAEKLLKKEGYYTKLIPTPRELSSDCGIALRFQWDRHESVESALVNTGIEFDSVHCLQE